MASFTRQLCNLEKEFILTKQNRVDYNVIDYDEVRTHLSKLIKFVEDGIFVSRNVEKFICKNFRKKNAAITSAYNKAYPDDKMTDNAMGVIKNRIKPKFYKLFGTNFDDIYYNGDIEGMQRISNICDAMRMEYMFNDNDAIFISDVYKKVSRSSDIEYDFTDCEKEFKLLRRLTKTNIDKFIDLVDTDKLAYILDKLQAPIFNEGENNINYVKVLASVSLFSLQDMDKTEMIPLEYKGKIHSNNEVINEDNTTDNVEIETVSIDSSAEIEETVIEYDNTQTESDFISSDEDTNENNNIEEGLTFLSNHSENTKVDNDYTIDFESLMQSVNNENYSFEDGDIIDYNSIQIDTDAAQQFSIFKLIDTFNDYIVKSEVDDSVSTAEELKNQVKEIGNFFALYTQKGIMKYLEEKHFNKKLFKKVLDNFQESLEKQAGI